VLHCYSLLGLECWLDCQSRVPGAQTGDLVSEGELVSDGLLVLGASVGAAVGASVGLIFAQRARTYEIVRARSIFGTAFLIQMRQYPKQLRSVVGIGSIEVS
jgi:hypothetical protein